MLSNVMIKIEENGVKPGKELKDALYRIERCYSVFGFLSLSDAQLQVIREKVVIFQREVEHEKNRRARIRQAAL
jgi:hypothetical protein